MNAGEMPDERIEKFKTLLVYKQLYEKKYKECLLITSASLVGFVVLKSLLKLLGQRIVIVIAVVVLFCGCVLTTYMPLFERISSIHIDRVNCRNGLFYAFPYMALGMAIAKHSIISGGG